MAEATTIARPYAHAIFAVAKEQGALEQWRQLLTVFAACTADASLKSLIANPKVANERVTALIADIAGDLINDDARNTLALLAANKRLHILGDIATIYQSLLAEQEQVLTAEVMTAQKLTSEQLAAISAALKARLGSDIILHEQLEESLLGGAIIRAGDMVIDGSVLGKLKRLASATS